ncbi:MAG: flagellar hook-basal body complex protein FliE [Neptuniibacter sp.]
MERTDINSVLMQMRAIKSQVQVAPSDLSQAVSPIGSQGITPNERTGFGEILKSAVDGVSDVQADAKKMAVAYEQGVQGIDLPQVMIAAEKASVSFEAMTQVRNRLVSAYEDIMKMPI